MKLGSVWLRSLALPTPPGGVFRAGYTMLAILLEEVSHVEGGWGRPGQI